MATPAIDYDNMRRALVHAIASATGVNEAAVITSEPEQPDAPRPALPYFSFKFITAAIKFGDDVNEFARAQNGAVTNTLCTSGMRSLVVSCNAYGKSHEQAYGLMATWQAALEAPPVQQFLRGFNIAVWRTSAVTDVSALLNTGYEGRAQMDLTLGTNSALFSTFDNIETASIYGQVDNNQNVVSLPPIVVTEE